MPRSKRSLNRATSGEQAAARLFLFEIYKKGDTIRYTNPRTPSSSCACCCSWYGATVPRD